MFLNRFIILIIPWSLYSYVAYYQCGGIEGIQCYN